VPVINKITDEIDHRCCELLDLLYCSDSAFHKRYLEISRQFVFEV